VINDILNKRLQVVLETLNLIQFRDELTLIEFVKDCKLSVASRSAILYLVIKASYPSKNDIKELSNLLSNFKYSEAIEMVLSYATSSDLKRELKNPGALVLDVTRYSSVSEISGIPRVIKNFITSTSAVNRSYGVWSQKIFGPVTTNIDGDVKFNKKIWGKTWALKLYRSLRKSYFFNSKYLLNSKLFKPFLIIIMNLKVINLLKHLSYMNLPKVCFIINPKQFILLEVPSIRNCEILLLWCKSIDITYNRSLVHDILPLTHPHYFKRESFQEHILYLSLLKCFDKIIVGTPILKHQIETDFKELISSTTINVLPIPVNLPTTVRSSQFSSSKYFLFIGGFQARKGLTKLFELIEKFGIPNNLFSILVIGRPNSVQFPKEDELYWRISQKNIDFKVISYVNDQTLSILIRDSIGVLYLSDAEGYGLPVLESLYHNKIVIASDTEVNRYFNSKYGGIHILTDPYSISTMEELCEIARKEHFYRKIKSSINYKDLPRDIENWVFNFLNI
jgi:glycosyltransferase involved in cell wall biosynthesis